jgi:MFS family permease
MKPRGAWLVAIITVAMVLAALVFSVLGGVRASSGWGTRAVMMILCVPTLAFAVVGLLIARRQPRNAVGWICLGTGMSLALVCFPVTYALYVIKANPGSLPGGATAAWIGNWGYVPAIGLFGIFLPLVFPTGRLLSPRWRWVVWIGVPATVVTAVGAAILPGPLEDSVASVINPYGVSGSEPLEAVFGLLPICMVAAAASIVIRTRRSSGTEREQLKWFAAAAIVFAAVFAVEIVANVFLDLGQSLGTLEDLLTLAFSALPVAIGIAMLRHRLYDIDVVINRTLVYGSLTATLAGVYAGSVLLLQLVLSGLTQGSGLAVAASTLAVAALFRPVRSRIQKTVDRRFFRSRYDATQTIESFGARLRDELDLDALDVELRRVVADTMQPSSVTLWLRVST